MRREGRVFENVGSWWGIYIGSDIKARSLVLYNLTSL